MRTRPDHIPKTSLPIRLWGDNARWGVPGAERMTFDLPTVSGLIGAIESIYWKPEIRYVIDRVEILSEPKTMLVTTNEVKTKVSLKGRTLSSINVQPKHTQRSSLILCQPDYIVWVRPYLKDFDPTTYGAELAKHVNMLRRRAELGQCFKTPYLGCREFSANFCVADDTLTPIPVTRYIGTMPFLRNYQKDSAQMTMIPNLTMNEGVIDYPMSQYETVWAMS